MEKPLYLENQDEWLSWLLLRISEAGRWDETMAQFYASYLISIESDSERLPEFVDAMKRLYGRIYHLMNNENEIWPGLLAGGPPFLVTHDAWNDAIADVVKREDERDPKERFDLAWYTKNGPDGGEHQILTENRGEVDVVDFAPELLDRMFAVHWKMEPIKADFISIRLGGEHWLMARKQAFQIAGLIELADSGMDVDPDIQILYAILENMKDAARHWDEAGDIRTA